MRALVLSAAVVLGACTASASSSSMSSPPVSIASSSTVWTQTAVDRAVAFMAARPQDAQHGSWSRGVLLASSVSGPADHLRWSGVVVLPNGHVKAVESDYGTSAQLNLLLQPGDYFRFKLDWGIITEGIVQVLQKGALP